MIQLDSIEKEEKGCSTRKSNNNNNDGNSERIKVNRFKQGSKRDSR